MSIEEIIEKLQEAVDLGDAPHRGPFGTHIRKEYLVEAIALLKTHPEAQHNEAQGCEWRSVNDPPKTVGRYMVVSNIGPFKGCVTISAYFPDGCGWAARGVTHWRPLPEPPKEEN